MGTFKSFKVIDGSPSLIPQVGRDIMNYFLSENYDVNGDSLMSGGYDISVSKGSMFKAVLGMKTALKIVIRPQGEQIAIEAGVGIFGQQAVPTVISLLVFWPVLITQVWGLVQQSKLDEKVIEIAAESVLRHGKNSSGTVHPRSSGSRFCTNCGTSNNEGANYCRQCGSKL